MELARDQPSCSTQRQEKTKVCTEFDIVLIIPVATCPHIRQALVGLERGASCFSDPVVPDDEGLTLLPYTGDECLTYEGEINKLAVNVAFGRYERSGRVQFEQLNPSDSSASFSRLSLVKYFVLRVWHYVP